MIVYDLICEFDHEFEGWFKDSSEFESQQDSGLLTCPMCGAENVVRVPSASRINLGKGQQQLDTLKSMQQDAAALANKLNDFIEKNFEDVGNDFADVAKKIHYGQEDERNIRGMATSEEAQELSEEGIDILPLPKQPKKDKLN